MVKSFDDFLRASNDPRLQQIAREAEIQREQDEEALYAQLNSRVLPTTQDLEEDVRVIGTYALCNWGGYEVGEDEYGSMFYRWNDGEHVGHWEDLETEYNPEDDYREYAYNPDQQAFLFPMDEVMRVER